MVNSSASGLCRPTSPLLMAAPAYGMGDPSSWDPSAIGFTKKELHQETGSASRRSRKATWVGGSRPGEVCWLCWTYAHIGLGVVLLGASDAAIATWQVANLAAHVMAT